MRLLVELHGQPGWVDALTPLSVDGMIVAASTTLLADSRRARRGGALSWPMLVAGSIASLAANVAVAEPTMTGRVIAAWPSFALIGSYELLMRQIRTSAAAASLHREPAQVPRGRAPALQVAAQPGAGHSPGCGGHCADGRSLRQEALQWAMTNRSADGKLPSGKAIAEQFSRHERWGRLVKHHGDESMIGASGPNAA